MVNVVTYHLSNRSNISVSYSYDLAAMCLLNTVIIPKEGEITVGSQSNWRIGVLTFMSMPLTSQTPPLIADKAIMNWEINKHCIIDPSRLCLLSSSVVLSVCHLQRATSSRAEECEWDDQLVFHSR